MAYALKLGGQVVPLTGLIDPKVLIEGGRNTIVFEQDDAVRAGVFKLFATNHSPESPAQSLRDLLCCLPQARCAGGSRLRQRLPRADHAVHRRVLVRRPLGQEDLRPHRPSGRPADPVRHVQPVLPRHAGADAAGAAARVGRILAARGVATCDV